MSALDFLTTWIARDAVAPLGLGAMGGGQGYRAAKRDDRGADVLAYAKGNTAPLAIARGRTCPRSDDLQSARERIRQAARLDKELRFTSPWHHVYNVAIDHGWLVRFVEHRIGDPRVVRHIEKWLNAGALEDEKWKRVDEGTPQDGSISPLLANVFGAGGERRSL